MSAFLGKIHYWLFNKIQLHESLLNSIADEAGKKCYDIQSLIEKSYEKFGYPVQGQLEEKIEHSNIHGWLQERIVSVEQRLAYVITELINKNILSKAELGEIFRFNAESIMEQLDLRDESPQDMYTLIFDYMLEGMPCDRVNEIVQNNENEISWETTTCLHKAHWDEVGGDVNNFYFLRDNWINGFLGASGTNYSYNRTEDKISTIRRE